MYYIGVDFSINYPGICIADQNFKNFKWIACINTDIPKKYRKFLEDAELQYPSLKFVFIEGKQRKNDLYHVTERNKLSNQTDLIAALIQTIKIEINNSSVIVAIEGMSFGSPGNSIIDLAHATGIFKAYFYRDILNSDRERFFVFSPSELKNSIGAKGNCGKIEIFEAFLRDPILESLRDSDLFRFVKANRTEIFNGKVIKSPIMDMIDATLPIIKLASSL